MKTATQKRKLKEVKDQVEKELERIRNLPRKKRWELESNVFGLEYVGGYLDKAIHYLTFVEGS